MSKFSPSKMADIVADPSNSYGHRTSALNNIGGVSGTFLHLHKFPDFKHSLSVLFKVAADPKESIGLRTAALSTGVRHIMWENSNAYPWLVERDPRNAKILQDNLGNPDLILSQLLDIGEDQGNPDELRKTALDTGVHVCNALKQLGDAYILPEELKKRFAWHGLSPSI